MTTINPREVVVFKDTEYSKMVKDLKVKLSHKMISYIMGLIIARRVWVKSLRRRNKLEKEEGEIQNKIIWVQAEEFAAQVVINRCDSAFNSLLAHKFNLWSSAILILCPLSLSLS